MKPVLLRALRIIIRADSDPARQALFANLMKSRLSVRLAYGLHERLGGGTWASTLLVSCYGLATFLTIAPSPNRTARLLAVAQHTNARRQVLRVASWVGQADCACVRTGLGAIGPSGLGALGVFLPRGRLVRVLRIIRAVDRRHGFLVSCRAAGAIAWYLRGRALLRVHKPGAVLVSSDSNPEEVGFASAARAMEIPQVFVSHAYPTPYSPPLDFSLSILEGEAAAEIRRRRGPIKGEILLAGLEGDSAPMDPRRFERSNPMIGIFPPKALSWSVLAAIIDDCHRHFHARQIVIRWHPSMLEPPRLAHLPAGVSQIVESSKTALLPEVAGRCDWVIADENSNVHLPVLKLGIPTVAVKSLGLYPESRSDLYGFAARGIVFPAVSSIREVEADALIAFFSEGWPIRFRQYDASYLQTTWAIGSEVRPAIWRLFEGSATRATYA